MLPAGEPGDNFRHETPTTALNRCSHCLISAFLSKMNSSWKLICIWSPGVFNSAQRQAQTPFRGRSRSSSCPFRGVELQSNGQLISANAKTRCEMSSPVHHDPTRKGNCNAGCSFSPLSLSSWSPMRCFPPLPWSARAVRHS